MADKIFDVDLRADGPGVNRAKLLQFGYRTFASEASMNATTTGNTPGEIAYVSANGKHYGWNAVASQWQILENVQNVSFKPAVRAAELAANVNLAAPGATIDGVTMAAGDRFLVAGQSNPAENGVYLFDAAGTAAVRVADLDDGGEADAAVVAVEEGAVNGDKLMMQTADDVTIGTDAQTWSTIGPSAGVSPATTAVAGVVLLATAAQITAGAGTTVPTVTDVTSMIDNRGGSVLFGDASATTFVLPHGIGGMAGEQLIIQITRESDDAQVTADTRNDDTNLLITTLSVPGVDAYRATYWFAG